MIIRFKEDLNSLNIKYKDNSFIFIPSILLLIIGFTVHYFFGFEAAIIVELSLITFVLVALLFHVYRSVEKDLEEERTQTQAIQSIYTFITPRYPLPSMSRWTAYPDLAETIVRECMINKPKLVVELGSGISTLITAYALEQHGENDAHIISLDHSKEYTQKTQDLLTVHQLKSSLVVEWRALTVALLDKLAEEVRSRTGNDATSLPLASVLQGGTWSAGRRIASKLRKGGTPPLSLQSSGTIF